MANLTSDYRSGSTPIVESGYRRLLVFVREPSTLGIQVLTHFFEAM